MAAEPKDLLLHAFGTLSAKSPPFATPCSQRARSIERRAQGMEHRAERGIENKRNMLRTTDPCALT